jgi:hypothetical protein
VRGDDRHRIARRKAVRERLIERALDPLGLGTFGLGAPPRFLGRC